MERHVPATNQPTLGHKDERVLEPLPPQAAGFLSFLAPSSETQKQRQTPATAPAMGATAPAPAPPVG